MPSIKKREQLRLRVFAGPNGSGKSTVIESIRAYKTNGRRLDFGYYINADEIAKELRVGGVHFKKFRIKTTATEFKEIALASGLINKDFPDTTFLKSYVLEENQIRLLKHSADERLAQIIADFLRKKLLSSKKKFSFETVFSHSSKLDIMKEAVEAGYKVYLYFVGTSDPAINVFRVETRVMDGGHDVPANKIVERYYKSLGFLYEASQLAYQAFFFDNSKDGEEAVMFESFKSISGSKQWSHPDTNSIPDWFVAYYSDKIPTEERKGKK